MEQQMFDLKEAAKILGVSYPWLDRRVRTGGVKIVHLGGKRSISIEEIDRIKKEGVK